MNKKSIDIKKTLLDNGIIIVLLLLVLITGITKDNFFSWNNLSNISVNTAARVIIAFGVSGCLITYGGPCFLYRRYFTADRRLQRKVLPEPGRYAGIRSSASVYPDLLHFRPYQWYRYRVLKRTCFHRYPGHAAGCIRHLPGLHKRNSSGRLS